MNTIKTILIFALLIAVTFARPQNNFLVFATTAAPNRQTTTAAPNTPTTASPQYLACLQSCPSTMEYNPICGSDSINYHNSGRLSCAQRCGKNVAAVRAGTCRPL